MKIISKTQFQKEFDREPKNPLARAIVNLQKDEGLLVDKDEYPGKAAFTSWASAVFKHHHPHGRLTSRTRPKGEGWAVLRIK